MIYNPDPCSEKGEFPEDMSACGRTLIQLLDSHSSATLIQHEANISFLSLFSYSLQLEERWENNLIPLNSEATNASY